MIFKKKSKLIDKGHLTLLRAASVKKKIKLILSINKYCTKYPNESENKMKNTETNLHLHINII